MPNILNLYNDSRSALVDELDFSIRWSSIQWRSPNIPDSKSRLMSLSRVSLKTAANFTWTIWRSLRF